MWFKGRVIINQNSLFFIFYVLMLATSFFGLNSKDFAYHVLQVIAAIPLICTLIYLKYKRIEIITIFIMLFLVFGNIILGGERTLMIPMVAIAFSKGIDIDELIIKTIPLRISFVLITVILALTGIIKSNSIYTPKNGTYYSLYNYGFVTANVFFEQVFIILLCYVVMYFDRIKLWHMIMMTLLMSIMYMLTLCRTGFYLWVVLIVLFGITRFYEERLGKAPRLQFIPLVSVALSVAIVPIYRYASRFFFIWNSFTNGRFVMMLFALLDSPFPLVGKTISYTIDGRVNSFIDSSYIALYMGSGIVLFLIVICALLYTCFRLYNNNRYSILFALAILSIYAFMERGISSVFVNPFILYIGQYTVFGERKSTDKMGIAFSRMGLGHVKKNSQLS